MLIVHRLVAGARGLAPVLVRRAAHVELGWERRSRSRFDAVDSAGRLLGVFLPRGSVLRGGDVLVGEDGSLVAVRAAAEAVLVVRAPAGHPHPGAVLARAAYHLGNRHVAVEVRDDHLKLEADPVLAEMLRRMPLDVVAQQAPFEPEGGAYDGVRGHAHAAHGHGHGH